MMNTNLDNDIKIKNYISEYSTDAVLEDSFGSNNIVDVNLTDEQLLELFKTNYSEAYNRAKKGFFIFRGDSYESDVLIRKPGIRVSKNGSLNYYNRLLSGILPSWKDFPYRNHSFICTTSLMYANKWNNKTSIVLPRNDTKIAICPTYDMWKSFSVSNISRLIYFNLDLDYFFIYFTGKDSSYTNTLFMELNNENIISYLNEVTDSIKNCSDEKIDMIISKIERKFYNPSVFIRIISDIRKNDLSFIEVIDNILNPIDNNFTCQRMNKFNVTDIREIWFSDNAIFLDLNYLFENKKSEIYKDLFK